MPDNDRAADVQAASMLFLESTTEMYRGRGHSEAEAKKLAEALVNSRAKHQLPDLMTFDPDNLPLKPGVVLVPWREQFLKRVATFKAKVAAHKANQSQPNVSEPPISDR